MNMNAPESPVRYATEDDVPALLQLMRGLAEFEGYADNFAVTEDTLLSQGFRRNPPDFRALVVDGNAGLDAMLVYYFIPFTYYGRPVLVIKELFVSPHARGRGIGAGLMREAARAALDSDCACVQWQVADWNANAAEFYARFDAVVDRVWLNYRLSAGSLQGLAGRET